MTTPLEIHALKQLPPLDAAQRLVAASTGELWAVVTLCGVKVRVRADKQELVNAILAHTHPRPAPAAAEATFTQERFV